MYQGEAFYVQLTDKLKSGDDAKANRVIMEELGKIIAKDKPNFIALLRFSDIAVSDDATDSELIKTFIDNIHNNRKLMLGSSLFINSHNKTVGFDGEEEISDAGVHAVNKVMYNYFNGGEFDFVDESGDSFSNAGGVWAGAIDSVAKTTGKALEGRQKKKYGTQDLLVKKQESKIAMQQSAMEQRKMQQEAALKSKAEKDKKQKILLYGGLGLLGLALVVGAVILIKKR